MNSRKRLREIFYKWKAHRRNVKKIFMQPMGTRKLLWVEDWDWEKKLLRRRYQVLKLETNHLKKDVLRSLWSHWRNLTVMLNVISHFGQKRYIIVYSSKYILKYSFLQKIHEDKTVWDSEKFQYLLQVVVPNSKAARMVERFQGTSAIYQQAIH